MFLNKQINKVVTKHVYKHIHWEYVQIISIFKYNQMRYDEKTQFQTFRCIIESVDLSGIKSGSDCLNCAEKIGMSLKDNQRWYRFWLLGEIGEWRTARFMEKLIRNAT